MDLTLLELSLDGADITANAPFSGRSSTEPEASAPGDDASSDRGTTFEIDAEEPEEETGGGSAATIGAVVALVLLVVLAALVRRRRGGDESIEVE